MAFTLWCGTNAGGGGNAPFADTLTNLMSATGATAGTGPVINAWLYGFMDGGQKFRSFYSSSANAIALPTMVLPPVIPTNFYNCGTAQAGAVYQLIQTGGDYGAGTTLFAGTGPYLVTLAFAAGSPDSASPFQFTLDEQAVLVVSSVQYQGL